VREPVRIGVQSGSHDTATPDSNRDYLQRLAELLFRPVRRDDGTV